ncbi:MAG: transcription elongation factor GreAB [Puniceicoccaceae bacterium]
MNKHAVIEAVLAELMNQLDLVRGASREAAEYATHEESRADSKWDTQGLEASYLAAGQGAQVLEVGNAIQVWTTHRDAMAQCRRIESGALFSLKLADAANWYFLSTASGGLSVEVDGKVVTVITAQSPIARQLVGRMVGESVLLPNGTEAFIEDLC